MNSLRRVPEIASNRVPVRIRTTIQSFGSIDGKRTVATGNYGLSPNIDCQTKFRLIRFKCRYSSACSACSVVKSRVFYTINFGTPGAGSDGHLATEHFKLVTQTQVAHVPTIAEADVPGYEAASWNGLMTPAGVAPAIIAKMHKDAAIALQSAEVRDKLAADCAEAISSTRVEFTRFIRGELKKWGRVIKAAGLRAD